MRLVKLIQAFEISYAASRAAAVGQDPNSMDVDATVHDRTIIAEAYSSDLSPSARNDILKRFKEGKISMFVLSPSFSFLSSFE